MNCWHMEAEGEAGHADLVWKHPASRCFPTCSEGTHSLNAAERDASPLAKHVLRPGSRWSWAGIAGMEFTFDEAHGGGVLITPWGHGTWGIVASRGDVLVAEFAQKRHMLRFERPHQASFVSTRCDDGEVVAGKQLG